MRASFKFGNKYPSPLRYEFSGSGKLYIGLNYEDSDNGFYEDGPIDAINFCPYCGEQIKFEISPFQPVMRHPKET